MPRQRIQRERQILETLDAHDGKWVFIVADSYSASKASSIRRAARRLKEKGIIDIEHRVSRREGKAPRRRLAAKRHRRNASTEGEKVPARYTLHFPFKPGVE